MIANLELEDTARELLEREWSLIRQSLGPRHTREAGGECPGLWLLPELIERMDQSHDRPAHELAPVIRQRLAEGEFVNENGDSIIPDLIDQSIDRQVELLVRVLEETRLAALAEGQWSSMPATPIMFG